MRPILRLLAAAWLLAVHSGLCATAAEKPIANNGAEWAPLDPAPLEGWFRSNVAIINPGIVKIYPMLGLKGEMPPIDLVSISGPTADCSSPMGFGFYSNENGQKSISMCENAFHQIRFFARQQARVQFVNLEKISLEKRYQYFIDMIDFFRVRSAGLAAEVAPCPVEYYAFLDLNKLDPRECFTKSAIRKSYYDTFFVKGDVLNFKLLEFYESEYEISGTSHSEKIAHIESVITTGIDFGSFYHVYLHELAHVLLNHTNAEGCQLYKEEAEADALAEKMTLLLAERSYLNNYGALSAGIKMYHMLNIADLITESGLGSVESDDDVNGAMQQAVRNIGMRRTIEVMQMFGSDPELVAVISKAQPDFDLSAMPKMAGAIALLDQCDF